MNIHFAAETLNGDVSSRDTVLCPGPGHSAGDRSLSVTFDANAPDGFLVNSFANDDWQDCRDHVRQLLGLGSFEGQGRKTRPIAHVAPRLAVPTPEAVRRQEFAASLWQEARPIGGSLAERYLIGRGIVLHRDIFDGRALRFHPACPFRLDSGETIRLPSMLGAMVNIETSAFAGIHRTALAAGGHGKARVRGLDDAKKMLGSNKGACVKLFPDEAVTTGLAIAEGIETALSVIGNFGFSPTWAALTAGTISHFPVLPYVECLSIFADNDLAKMQGGRLRQAGNEAAMQCAERWTATGRESVIWTPPDIGSDFNDLSGRIAA
ncbi:DUF7146 domain-containing protein [Mesorhizobium sp. A556]